MSVGFTNDNAGRRTRIILIGTDGSELELARYAYDAQGRMTDADCAFGMSVHYQWQAGADLLDSWHNVTRASETHFNYDETGRVIHTRTNGIWNDDRFDYRQGETAYLPGGKSAAAQRFQYDANENVTAEIDALGGVVAHRYNGNGFRTATTDPNGNTASTHYDVWGNVKEFTDAEARSTIYGWGDYGELDIVIDGAGNRKTYEHDARAYVISETDAEGNVTRLERDHTGRVIKTTFANGASESRTYDDFNRLVGVTDALGHVTAFSHDAFGQLIETVDALGGRTRQSYAAGAGGFDSSTEATRPDGVSTTRSFDGTGMLASVRDGEGRTWRYAHVAFGVLNSITDPKGGALSFGYDIEGRILTVTNALGRVYCFTRDAAGRVTEEEDFDGRVKRYTRDAAGQVVETLKPDGARLAYGYDKTGLLRRIESFAPDGQSEDVTRFWYDARGLLIQAENKAALVEIERDRNGRIIEECLNGKRVKSGGDAMGSRVLREIVHADGSDLARMVRDPLGAVEKLVAGETQLSFERDGLGLKVWKYGWDAQDRLVLCVTPEFDRWTFGYDPFGRRVSKVKQMPEQERARAALVWPDPTGRTDTPEVGTAYLWDGDQHAEEAPLHQGGRIDWDRAVKWHYEDGGFTPIAKELPDGQFLHIVSDHLGTLKEMFDAKGALVWAADHHVWGAVRTIRAEGSLAPKPSHDPQQAELLCPFRFLGQYEDAETGPYYNRHRHYDPLTGQYASPDPIGLAGGDRPQDMWMRRPFGLIPWVCRL